MSHELVRSKCDRQISCPICASRGHWAFDSRFVEVHRCENEQCTHLFAVSVDSNHGVMNAVGSDAEESMYAEQNERLITFWEDRRFVTVGSKLLDVGREPATWRVA
jgi:hypothetical protein